jgi:nitroreductase
MNIRELVTRNRSYRRFHQQESIDEATLRELVDLARLTASGKNAQPLKYYLSSDEGENAAIFQHLGWAGYLKDWSGPVEGERPAAYIVVLGDKKVDPDFGVDHGIAAQTILLGATELGLGGCVIATVNRRELGPLLGLAKNLQVLFVIALGKPKEQVVLTEVGADGDIKYWRDADGVHHVPKRSLEEIVIRSQD